MFFFKYSKPITLIVTVLTIIIFFYKGTTSLDPDFGWHIRLGELTSQAGVFKTDPFSYTMPSYPFIDHEWLTNIVMFKLFNMKGKPLLGIVFVSIAFFALLLVLKKEISIDFKSKKPIVLFKIFLFVVGTGTLLPFFGVRPQVLSWLFFAITVNLIQNDKLWKKYAFFISILTIFWVNLHGSFAVSIISLFIVFVLRSVREKVFWTSGLTVLIFSTLASGVNPYGFRIWKEVWVQVSDTSLKWTIQEWQPAFLSFNIFYLFLAVLSVMLIKKYYRAFTLEQLGLNLFFFLQAFLSIRHIPLWLVVDLPMVYFGLSLLYKDVKKIKHGEARFNKVINGALYGVIIFFFAGAFLQINNTKTFLKEDSFYPKKALEFIKNNPTQNNIFSEYGWGGYLVWKLPEKKVFIDGRMPSWRRKLNIEGESNYAMQDYKNILNGQENYAGHFSKYNIDTVLWPKPKKPGAFSRFENSILSFVTGGDYLRKKFDLFSALEKDGWTKVYEDGVSVIYQKI